MRTVDLLLSSSWILPIAPNNTTLENHAIAIHEGKIVAVLNTNLALQQFHAKEHIHLDQHVLMPGLVNAHTHTPMTLFRGLADDLELSDWLQYHIWPAENTLVNAPFVAAGSRLAIAEMIRGGTTCFSDNYFFPDITAQIADEEGMRACIGMPILSVPTGWAKDEEEYLKKAKIILENPLRSHLITYSLCPHSPYSVSEINLIKTKELAEAFQIPIHMHVHETRAEIESSLIEHKVRPIQRLHELGLLSNKFISAHSVHMTEQEIKLFQELGVHVSHCPESNLKLASGFAPIGKLLAAKINVGIGTDGAASNNDLDLFGEIKTAALIAKAVCEEPTALSAPEALAMATINGAKTIGLDHLIGSLEIGKIADIIAVDMSHYFTQPVFNPMSHLVYAMNRLQVSDVWIAGKPLLRTKEFVKLSTNKLIQDAQYWAEKARPFAFDLHSQKQTQPV